MPIEMHVNFSNFLTFPISVIECHSGAQPPHTYTPIHTQASGLNTKLSSCKALGHTNFQLRLIFHIKICITHTRKRQEIIKMHLCSAYTYIDTSMVQYIFIYVYAMCMTHFPFMISENYRKSIIFGNINKKNSKASTHMEFTTNLANSLSTHTHTQTDVGEYLRIARRNAVRACVALKQSFLWYCYKNVSPYFA